MSIKDELFKEGGCTLVRHRFTPYISPIISSCISFYLLVLGIFLEKTITIASYCTCSSHTSTIHSTCLFSRLQIFAPKSLSTDYRGCIWWSLRWSKLWLNCTCDYCTCCCLHCWLSCCLENVIECTVWTFLRGCNFMFTI